MELICFNKTKDKNWKSYVPRFKEIALKTCACLKRNEQIVLSIILVNDRKITEINKQYRQIDSVTDVISFCLCDWDEPQLPHQENLELGDIFINVDAVKRQAEEYNHSEEREICFLFTHGILHLFGYDHMELEAEKEMICMQKAILDEIVQRDD